MRYCYPLSFLLLIGCQTQEPTAIELQPDPARPQLQKVRSVTIKYSLRTEAGFVDRQLMVEAKEARALVDALHIQVVWRLPAVGAIPAATVDFHVADGASELLKFSYRDPQRLQWDPHGRVDLKDRAFYDLVNKLLSKKEGRPIDIFKLRDPTPPEA
jgi:hypothetical protein